MGQRRDRTPQQRLGQIVLRHRGLQQPRPPHHREPSVRRLDLFDKRFLLPEDQTYQYLTALIAVRANSVSVIRPHGKFSTRNTWAPRANSAAPERCPCEPPAGFTELPPIKSRPGSIRRTISGVHIDLTTIVVDDYDEAIRFFVDGLGFELDEDTPSLTNDGRPKRWVVVRPPGGETGLLLAKADGPAQECHVGNQFAGRVGLFLRVEDFDAAHQRMKDYGVEFITSPRLEPFGCYAVFLDIAGNKWDLLGPRP